MQTYNNLDEVGRKNLVQTLKSKLPIPSTSTSSLEPELDTNSGDEFNARNILKASFVASFEIAKEKNHSLKEFF